jgi:hypothetical protein
MKYYTSIITTVFLLFVNIAFGQTNLNLKNTIDSLFKIDQGVQQAMMEAMKNNLSGDSIAKLNEVQKATFVRHIPIIKKIYSQFGYPTIQMVGKESSTYYFVLIQHSDSEPEFQLKMLPVLKNLSSKKEVSIKDYAYLYDRVQRNTGGKQLYGTQLSYDKNGNLFDSTNKIIYPKDLADPKNVDKRRKKIGLEPLEKYYEQMLEMLGRPRQKK